MSGSKVMSVAAGAAPISSGAAEAIGSGIALAWALYL